MSSSQTFKSRKMWFTVGAIILTIVCWFATVPFHTLEPSFGTLVGAIVGLTATYLTGNIAHHFVDRPPTVAPPKAVPPKPVPKDDDGIVITEGG